MDATSVPASSRSCRSTAARRACWRPMRPASPTRRRSRPTGGLIAYSRWKPGGYRDIHIYDLTVGQRPGADGRSRDGRRPALLARRALTCCSRRTAPASTTSTRYELATAQLYQVTNVAVAVRSSPTVSPDGKQLVYTGFTSDGFDLYVDAVRSRGLPAGAAVRATRGSTIAPDADSDGDSPDAGRPAPTARAVITRTTRLPARGSTCTRAAGSFAYYSDGARDRARRLRQHDDRRSGRPTTSVGAEPAASPLGRRSVGRDRLRVPAAVAVVRRSRSGAPRSACRGLIVDGVDTLYQQHRPGRQRRRSRCPCCKTPRRRGELSLRLRLHRLRAGRSAAGRRSDGEGIIVRPSVGPTRICTCGGTSRNVHELAATRSATRQGARWSLSTCASRTRRSGADSARTELSWSWQEYLTPPWARLHALAMLWSGGIGIGDKRDFFGLGGFPEQDMLRTIFLDRPQCCTLPARLPAEQPSSATATRCCRRSTARRCSASNAATSTFPLYFRQLWGAAFVDAGNAYDGPLPGRRS